MGVRSRLHAARPLAAVLVLAFAQAAAASPETLQRSLQNILFAPADLVLSPVVAGQVIARNLETTDDPTAVRVIFVVPGYLWNTSVQLGAAVIRCLTGVLELLPGIALLPFEADLPVLFAPPEHGNALVDVDARVLRVRFGVDYLTLPR